MQQSNVVRMGCTMLRGTNKKGKLTPDKSGYYTVVLGAYGAYNSMGMFYDLQSAVPFFQEGSPLMRQLGKGVLRGEYKHPEPDESIGDANQREKSYINRICKIDSDRVAFHIRNLKLEAGHKDEEGRSIVLVLGEIRPSGPFKDILKDALENEHENVYFSVRSLTMDDMIRGVKYTRNIVTWDFVNEGGIYSANKYNAPGLESFGDIDIAPATLWELADEQKQQKAVGLETSSIDYAALAADLGWAKDSLPATKKPTYVDW
jgi:hypothetical protein